MKVDDPVTVLYSVVPLDYSQSLVSVYCMRTVFYFSYIILKYFYIKYCAGLRMPIGTNL